MLASQGTSVPASGKGSIGYVIAAYNNFETVRIDGVNHQLFGLEHSYIGGCPPTRTCGPVSQHAAYFDASACFAIRTDTGARQTYALRCLNGPDFDPTGSTGGPITTGEAFVSIRTIAPSPFAASEIYYGGYDCNFYPADGTAWVATSTASALGLGQ
jgi:hypothetical protein